MLELDAARTAIRREYDALIADLEATPGERWDAPLRLEGWTVRDLVAHVAGGQAMEAQALRRMVAGDASPAQTPEPDPGRDPAVLLDDVRKARRELEDALDELTPENVSGICPLPYGGFPGAMALQLFVLEAGLHHNDLLWGLGEQAPLAGDVVTAVADLVPAMLPFLAQGSTEPSPEPGAGYVLNAGSRRVALAYGADGWEVASDPAGPTAEISGDESMAWLFVLGRVPLDHPGLRVEGNRELAARFKGYFPGP